MSGAESKKKRRLATLLGTPVQRHEYVTASVIKSLPYQTLCDILLDAADQHRDVISRIAFERDNIVAAEQATTGDFQMYLERVLKLLNADYGCQSRSQQYQMASEVSSAIQETIHDIEKGGNLSFENRKRALETLVKIGRNICLSDGRTLGDEVIRQFRSSCFLEATMLRIAKSIRVVHEKSVMTKEYSVMTYNFVYQLDELIDLSNKCCIFEGFEEACLSDVRKTLFAASDSDESEVHKSVW